MALALLVVVLAACLVGVTILRGPRGRELIFGAVWFNGLLVLLAVSSASAFFGRIWRRRLTIVSAGMIVFHLSFAAMLVGIVYDGLFSFWGVLRLTEGESLPLGRPESYDELNSGRFFDPSRLRGDATLVRMHANLEIEGENKQAVYELVVADGEDRTAGLVYATSHLDRDGVRFFPMKEGYSVLLVISDRKGREIYGAHVPLQSYRRPDGGYRYAAGSRGAPGVFAFPPAPAMPLVEVEMVYLPNSVQPREGTVSFRVRRLGRPDGGPAERAGEAPIGGGFDAGEYLLSPREIRYWVAVNVRHDPGLVAILSSLCLGLGGMILTFAGRIRQGAARRRRATAG